MVLNDFEIIQTDPQTNTQMLFTIVFNNFYAGHALNKETMITVAFPSGLQYNMFS